MVDPIDSGGMQLLAEKMKGLIHSVHGRTYTPEQASMLYPTAGDTTDWTYAVWNMVIDHRIASQQSGRRWVHPSSEPNPAHFRRKSRPHSFIGQTLDPDTVETRLQP